MSYYERHLPHWHPEGAFLFVTWRLEGSLPAHRCQEATDETAGEVFVRLDRQLDRAACGPLWLKDPRVAEVVVEALRRGEAERKLYRLCAYVVMANHVHVLLEPLAPLGRITHWIKGCSAHQANRILGLRKQSFWQHESYDHWARDERECHRIVRYIESNPVSAGLVSCIEEWPWSSASRGGRS